MRKKWIWRNCTLSKNFKTVRGNSSHREESRVQILCAWSHSRPAPGLYPDMVGLQLSPSAPTLCNRAYSRLGPGSYPDIVWLQLSPIAPISEQVNILGGLPRLFYGTNMFHALIKFNQNVRLRIKRSSLVGILTRSSYCPWDGGNKGDLVN